MAVSDYQTSEKTRVSSQRRSRWGRRGSELSDHDWIKRKWSNGHDRKGNSRVFQILRVGGCDLSSSSEMINDSRLTIGSWMFAFYEFYVWTKRFSRLWIRSMYFICTSSLACCVCRANQSLLWFILAEHILFYKFKAVAFHLNQSWSISVNIARKLVAFMAKETAIPDELDFLFAVQRHSEYYSNNGDAVCEHLSVRMSSNSRPSSRHLTHPRMLLSVSLNPK